MQDAPSIYRVAPPPPPPPAYRLFTTGQVTAAALFFSPIAGGILLALNRKRVGRGRDAAIALATGVGVTVLAGLVAAAFHRAGILTLGGVFALRAMAQHDQPLLEAHLTAGGKAGSWWTALGVPLLLVGAVGGGGALLAAQAGPYAYPTLEVGPHQHVRYGSGASTTDAHAAVDELQREGFIGQNPADLVVERRGASVVVGVVVRKDAWNEPETLQAFARIRDHLAARAFPGKDLKLALLDDGFDPQKTLEGPALARLEARPNQSITYEFSVGSVEAERLRDALVADGFFDDDGKGRDVKLSRVGDADVVGFVLGDGRWDDPVVVANFEVVRAKLAEHGLGDGKLRVDLCDDTFATKRTIDAK